MKITHSPRRKYPRYPENGISGPMNAVKAHTRITMTIREFRDKQLALITMFAKLLNEHDEVSGVGDLSYMVCQDIMEILEIPWGELTGFIKRTAEESNDDTSQHD